MAHQQNLYNQASSFSYLPVCHLGVVKIEEHSEGVGVIRGESQGRAGEVGREIVRKNRLPILTVVRYKVVTSLTSGLWRMWKGP